MPNLSFTVPGTPQQQGSKTLFKKGGSAWMSESNKRLKPWRAEFIDRAQAATDVELGQTNCVSAAMLLATFYFPRPQGHFGTGRHAAVLKPSAPKWKTSKPDVDKLLRAVLDGLTQAGLLRDDALVVRAVGCKKYGDTPRTEVHLSWGEEASW